MTNFFEQQEAARRRTTWLVFLYIVALLLTVTVSVAATVAILWQFMAPPRASKAAGWDDHGLTSNQVTGMAAAVATLQGLVILGASWYKTAQLSSGGKAVALMLGGQELLGQTRNARERRLLNVVEEMALASGVPVPAVYVMQDEAGINAFAAGNNPGDAVIGVSRGCLEYLTRDELQGVVAHEFSHILNGDMSLNLKLIGWVFGLVALSTAGYLLIRVLSDGRSNRSSNKDSKDGGGLVLALFLVGVTLYLAGIVGAFFGDMIKASISRQREYLADASAVQFTRNPDGIAGALKKIGGLTQGARLGTPSAPEASHLFFANALALQLFATHPPLADRIRRLDKSWNGTYPEVTPSSTADHERPHQAEADTSRGRLPAILPGMLLPARGAVLARAVDRVGVPTPELTEHAAELIDQVPAPLRAAAAEPFAARLLIYCLTLDRDTPLRDRQLTLLRKLVPTPEIEMVVQLLPTVDSLPEASRLPLLDLTIPALRRMSPEQYTQFRANLDPVVQADARLSVFEYLLYCVLERYLDPAFGRPIRREAGTTHGEVNDLVGEVLSLLAREGSDTEAAAQSAYTAGMSLFLNSPEVPSLAAREACTIEGLDTRLRRLALLPPRQRKQILLACAACIVADGKVTVGEVELCRAIGDVLGCPVPPLPVPTA